jgi:hypothetical protein
MMRWAGHVAEKMGEKRKTYRLLVGKPDGKRQPGRPRYRWVDNIKMDLGETGWGCVDWIGLAQDRDKWRALVNVVLNLRVPQSAGKFSSGCITSGLLSSAQLHKVTSVNTDYFCMLSDSLILKTNTAPNIRTETLLHPRSCEHNILETPTHQLACPS